MFVCGDGQDNDGDGLVDLADPECTSPCDDREDSFQTGLPTDGDDCRVDCYFDGDNADDDDRCAARLACDPKDPDFLMQCPQQSPEVCTESGVEVTKQCIHRCTPVTPNGCDCFGCCHFDGLFARDLYLGGNTHCRLDNLGACTDCTFNKDCANLCDRSACELCIGDVELPPGCDAPGCPAETEPCNVDEQGVSSCAPGMYCITGCCAPLDG